MSELSVPRSVLLKFDIQPAVLRFLSDYSDEAGSSDPSHTASAKQLLLDLVNRKLHEILGKFDLDGATHDGGIGLSDHAERARGCDHGQCSCFALGEPGMQAARQRRQERSLGLIMPIRLINRAAGVPH